MSQSESARFYIELDAFMKPIEMRSARLARLYPDTLEALSKLAAGGINMGIVTNTSNEAANYILENVNLKSFFKVVVTRNDATRLKPDPMMIYIAIARIGVDAEWFVGDTIVDAQATSRAGLRSIIVRRDGMRPSFSHDFFVHSLNYIVSIVF